MQGVIQHSYVAVRCEAELDVAYDPFLRALESRMGMIGPDFGSQLAASSPAEARRALEQLPGSSDFVVFQKIDHGTVLTLIAGQPARAMTYVFGNALIAVQMTKIEVYAGLYVPLRMMVRETGPRRVELTYDLPSSLLGQFSSDAITAVAESLDRKVVALIDGAASQAGARAA